LNCDKALERLSWFGTLSFEETVQMTAAWYRTFNEDPQNIAATTNAQIAEYQSMAEKRGLAWAN
jgi:CDP-glucose 4,6-dehydratase